MILRPHSKGTEALSFFIQTKERKHRNESKPSKSRVPPWSAHRYLEGGAFAVSFSVVIARNFIRTTAGIIPMTLIGDSSLTVNNQIVKGWTIMDQQMINIPTSEALSMIRANASRSIAAGKTDAFYWRGSFLKMDQLYGWFLRGCSSARTIEEYLDANPLHEGLHCSIAIKSKASVFPAHSLNQLCKTTSELERWIDRAKASVFAFLHLKQQGESGIEDAYISMEFGVSEPLRTTYASNTAVIAKTGRCSYVKSYINGKELNFTTQIDEAVVFPSVQDAHEQLGTCWTGLRFIKAPKHPEKRVYLLRYNRAGDPEKQQFLHFRDRSRGMIGTRDATEAKRFASVKDVARYVRTLVDAGYCEYDYQAFNFTTGDYLPIAK